MAGIGIVARQHIFPIDVRILFNTSIYFLHICVKYSKDAYILL